MQEVMYLEGLFNDTLLQLNFITAKLPKWFGERPGKKSGEPDSPEEDDDAANEAAADEDVPDELEEEYEYYSDCNLNDY